MIEQIPYIKFVGSDRWQVIGYSEISNLWVTSLFGGTREDCLKYIKALKLKEKAEKQLKELTK